MHSMRYKFVPTDKRVKIKCGFSLINIQPPASGYSTPLASIRYWSTDENTTQNFNNFVYFSLKQSINKK